MDEEINGGKTKEFYGIALYNINKNCLTGVYTNVPAGGEIFNEINKKKEKSASDPNDNIIGEYDCQFFEGSSNGNVYDTGAELRVTKKGDVYTFIWINGESHEADSEGRGYRMNDTQIAVAYWIY